MNDGGFGVGSVSNTNNINSGSLTIGGGSQTIPGTTTLPATNSVATVSTQYHSSTCQGCGGGPQTSYQLNFEVQQSNRLPVAVTLNSGSNLINTAGTVAIDMSPSNCSTCGNSGEFQYSALLAGGAPNVGDTYGFTVTYSDGTQDTGTTVSSAVTAFGSTGAVVGPSDLPTITSPASGTTASSDQPTFTWTDPTLANPGNYYYVFGLYPQSGCTGNCTIWQIPGSDVDSSGMPNTITTITWGTDPTGNSGNTPSGSSLCSGVLCSGATYNWYMSIYDASLNNNNGQVNEAQISVYFVAP